MKNKTELEKAIGKLISCIQKYWGDEINSLDEKIYLIKAPETENVMSKAHKLLNLSKLDALLQKEIADLSIEEYLGRKWVMEHPRVQERIKHITKII